VSSAFVVSPSSRKRPRAVVAGEPVARFDLVENPLGSQQPEWKGGDPLRGSSRRVS
jgi:hypothetical protein